MHDMAERVIEIEGVNPIEFCGPENSRLEYIKSRFPKLKIIVRGSFVKVIGGDDEVADFADKFEGVVNHLERFGNIGEKDIDMLLSDDAHGEAVMADDVIVYGRNGLQVKALTANQKRMVAASAENDMVFAIGPAGTGKTYTAVALAVKALKERRVKRIILTRPAVEAGENLGFLPGDMKDKLDPYLQPLYDALRDMIPSQKLESYLEDRTIEIAPLAYMRGRTLDNAFAILDEAQNATRSQLKMFLTRMGRSAKFIITGDITQIDLPKNQPSGLPQAMQILKDINGIEFIMLDDKDVVRHRLVTQIVNAYAKHKENENQTDN